MNKYIKGKFKKGIIRWLALLTAMVVLATSFDLAQFSVLAETDGSTEMGSGSGDTFDSTPSDGSSSDSSSDGADTGDSSDMGGSDNTGSSDDSTGGFNDGTGNGGDIDYGYGEEFEGDSEEESDDEIEYLFEEEFPGDEDEFLLNLESADGEDLQLLGAGSEVTFDNGGYPYGVDMSGSSITFKLKIKDGTASSYQWQVGDSKDGTFSNISGATSASYTNKSLSNRKWYRCMVNGVSATKAVMAIQANKDTGYTFCVSSGGSVSGWYLSNGSMAYSVKSNNKFDIVGLYTKNGKNYWINTSYDSYWNLGCTNNPASKKWEKSSTDTALAEIVMAFDDKINNDHVVKVDCTLASNCTALALGTDTMLGSSGVTNVSDDCSLKAIMNGDTLKQIQMVDALSLDSVTDPNTASYVFIPTTQCTYYWIGYWNSRKAYCYNTQTEDSTTDNGGTRISSWSTGGQKISTEVQDLDSGMCVSWTGIEPGGHVKFQFNIGTLAQTGAETKSTATAYSITVEEADQNHYYALFRKDTGEMVRPWVTDTDNDGKVIFEDLEQDTEYIVKNVTESVYDGNPNNPNQRNPGSEETKTEIDPLNPSDSGEGEEPRTPPVVTKTSTSIDITNLDERYKYWLEDADGEPLSGTNGTPRTPSGANVEVLFDGLQPGTTYYLAAVTDNNPSYEPRAIQTLCAAFFYDNEHGTTTPTQYNLAEGAHVTKPTDPASAGFVFDGWYTTSDCTDGTEWDFDNNTLGT